MSGLAGAIGGVAAVASVCSFAPQAWKIIKTRETGDLSRATWVLTAAGFLLWGIYGALIGAWPLLAESAVCVVLSSFIAVMAILPRTARHAVADALDPSADERRATRPGGS